MDVLRDLRIQEPFQALSDEWDFWRDLIHDISDWLEEDNPLPQEDQEVAPVEGNDADTSADSASGTDGESKDASLLFLIKTHAILHDPSKVKPFQPPGSLVYSQSLYHTPPLQCELVIRSSAKSLLPVSQNMSQVGILQVSPNMIENSFPVFLVPKFDGFARLIYDYYQWTPKYNSSKVFLPKVTDSQSCVLRNTFRKD